MPIGAHLSGPAATFTVWAPLRSRIELKILTPEERILPMESDGDGLFSAMVPDLAAGADYLFVLDGEEERPDPASHFQPQGVHGPSRLVDHAAHRWRCDRWNPPKLPEMILYELHVGTFTPEGTFDGVASRLDHLAALGVNAVELMPVAPFPGDRNWGYDGVYPHGVHHAYGGPDGLKRLADACHERDMALVLDVVYNHLGPEGNYLSRFGPYFTDHYRTPWGDAVNFDGPHSDGVRDYFYEQARLFFEDYRVDALRLDAVHAIYDFSAKPFLAELAERVEQLADRLDRKLTLVAESDLNDSRIIRPRSLSGYALDAQWSDDFHHALHTLLTGEDRGYYEDFGSVDDLARCCTEGYAYAGRHSRFRKRRHGNYAGDRPGTQFVVCSQNHDQVGNRALGERLINLTDFESAKLAAAAVLLSSFVPLLFMGEEFAETNPFLYFVSHTDPGLVEAVRRGRTEEFSGFDWSGEVPDPQSPETFERSRPDWNRLESGPGRAMFACYAELIRLRRSVPCLSRLYMQGATAVPMEEKSLLFIGRSFEGDRAFVALNFSDDQHRIATPIRGGRWRKLFDSADDRWLGPGATSPEALADGEKLTLRPRQAVLYHQQTKDQK